MHTASNPSHHAPTCTWISFSMLRPYLSDQRSKASASAPYDATSLLRCGTAQVFFRNTSGSIRQANVSNAGLK